MFGWVRLMRWIVVVDRYRESLERRMGRSIGGCIVVRKDTSGR